eukprot:15446_1
MHVFDLYFPFENAFTDYTCSKCCVCTILIHSNCILTRIYLYMFARLHVPNVIKFVKLQYNAMNFKRDMNCFQVVLNAPYISKDQQNVTIYCIYAGHAKYS